MKHILIALLLLLLPATARAQLPPVNTVAGPSTAPQFYSVSPDIYTRAVNERVLPAVIVAGEINLDLQQSTNYVIQNTAAVSVVNLLNPNTDPTRMNVVNLFVISQGTAFPWTFAGGVRFPFGGSLALSAVTGQENVLSLISHDQGTTWDLVVGPTYGP